MYEVLLKQKFDAKLVGNIGNPILSVKKVKQFLLLRLSYQLIIARFLNQNMLQY